MDKKIYNSIMQEHKNRVHPISVPKEQIANALYPLQTEFLNSSSNLGRQKVLDKVADLTKEVGDIEDLKDLASKTSNIKKYGSNYLGKKNNFANTNVDIVSNKAEIKTINGMQYVKVNDNDLKSNVMLDQVDLIEGNYISFHDYKDFLKKNEFDFKSSDAIYNIINTINESENFNRDSIFNNLKNNIIGSGNLESLINDNIFGNKSFKENFIETLMDASYEDLGLSVTEEEIKELDPTNDGKISMEDAVVIFGELTEDKNQTIDYVAEYFTKFAEQNRTKPNLQDQNKEQTGYDPYEFA